jgi:hypothetical protein
MKTFKDFLSEKVESEIFDDGTGGLGSAGFSFLAKKDGKTIIDGSVLTKNGLVNSKVAYTEKPSDAYDQLAIKKWIETKLMKGIKITPAFVKKFNKELEGKL